MTREWRRVHVQVFRRRPVADAGLEGDSEGEGLEREAVGHDDDSFSGPGDPGKAAWVEFTEPGSVIHEPMSDQSKVPIDKAKFPNVRSVPAGGTKEMGKTSQYKYSFCLLTGTLVADKAYGELPEWLPTPLHPSRNECVGLGYVTCSKESVALKDQTPVMMGTATIIQQWHPYDKLPMSLPVSKIPKRVSGHAPAQCDDKHGEAAKAREPSTCADVPIPTLESLEDLRRQIDRWSASLPTASAYSTRVDGGQARVLAGRTRVRTPIW